MLYKLPPILKAVVLYSFLFVTFGSLLEAFNPPAPAVASVVSSAVVAASTPQYDNTPKELIIPRLGLRLTITPGQYDPASKTWTLTDTGVQHAGMTGLPNEKSGNTLLYGHNSEEVLATTDKLIEGDEARIVTFDGRVYTYVFSGGRLVDPTDTSVLDQTGTGARLTLLTCDGWWDEKRRVMTFDFVSVK